MKIQDTIETQKQLTAFDLELLRLLSLGLTTDEIASELNYSRNYISKFLGNTDKRRSIYRKIGVTNAKQAVNWYLNRQNAELEVRNKELQTQNSELATQLLELATQHRMQFLFLRNVGIGIVFVILLAFIPFLAPSIYYKQFLLNVYIVVPLVLGIYGVWFYHTRLDSRISCALCIMSLGLICWFWAGFLWFLLDMKEGLESHYLSIADIFYFLQTLSLAFSFPLLWSVLYRRNQNDVYPWLALAMSLFIAFNAVASASRGIYDFHSIWLSIQAAPLESVNEVLVALADSIGLAFAICLLKSRPLVPLSIPLKSAIRLISWGMGFMFATDLAFQITNHLPKDDPLHYGGGGPLDLVYLLTFCLLGLGIVLGSTASEPIEEQLR